MPWITRQLCIQLQIAIICWDLQVTVEQFISTNNLRQLIKKDKIIIMRTIM